MGRAEGRETGPRPGAGLTLAGFAGGDDLEGTPPDELPPERGKRDLRSRDLHPTRPPWWTLGLGRLRDGLAALVRQAP